MIRSWRATNEHMVVARDRKTGVIDLSIACGKIVECSKSAIPAKHPVTHSITYIQNMTVEIDQQGDYRVTEIMGTHFPYAIIVSTDGVYSSTNDISVSVHTTRRDPISGARVAFMEEHPCARIMLKDDEFVFDDDALEVHFKLWASEGEA